MVIVKSVKGEPVAMRPALPSKTIYPFTHLLFTNYLFTLA